MDYPKIYLALDNCFAIKRWVEPETWGPLIQSMGFEHIEASFDNEIDFLYSPQWYIDEWFDRLATMEKEEGVTVSNFFTGYQTYRTVGLGHPDVRMARHLLNNWLKPAIKKIGPRGNRIGFSLHAIPDEAMQNPHKYQSCMEQVKDLLAEAAQCAVENGGSELCMEAMYVPYQTPWTIHGTREFLADVYARGKGPLYTTVDVGHMTGQRRFLKPTAEALQTAYSQALEGGAEIPYLGADSTVAIWQTCLDEKVPVDEAMARVSSDMADYPYLFSDSEDDGDPYAWLEALGCWSPVVHMQQTDNMSASHAAFTPKDNATGIIKGDSLLRAIAKSYEQDIPGMPPKAKAIYLSFEVFAKNTEINRGIIQKFKETQAYWREFIPEDGLPLDVLIARLGGEGHV